jgi:hypothetical protein
LIARSRNLDGSVLWAGNGIGSSTAADITHHLGLTGIAITPNAAFSTTTGAETGVLHATWKGQSGLDANAILLAYSYNGDANLDGNITFDDYAQANYGFLHGKSEYWWGNFDFSAPTPPATAYVTFDDYYMMKQAFLKKAGQGGAIPMGEVAGPFSVKAVARAGVGVLKGMKRRGKAVWGHRGNAKG